MRIPLPWALLIFVAIGLGAMAYEALQPTPRTTTVHSTHCECTCEVTR
jgi:hypothetical protein